MRSDYKQTAKFLTAAFQDMIVLINAMQGMDKMEATDTLKELGVQENTPYVYKIIRGIHKIKGKESQKLENLLKQVHYS